jgi:hypothetical protein
VARVKLNGAGYTYDICMDEAKMNELNINMLPVLQLKDGTLLGFKEILQYIDGGNLKHDN